MRFTVEFPLGVAERAEDVKRVAQAVDRLGYHALAFTEHPAPSRTWLDSPPGHPTFDLLTSLAFCAGVTERVRLMTFLAVLPYHRPFALAKALATIDVLSSGRVTAVVGAGYLRAEFEALGVDFDSRGVLLDEALAVLPAAWSGAPVTMSGSTFHADAVVIQPRPVQPGGPPIWVGGNTRAARERAATHGGWSPLLVGGAAAARINTSAIDGIDGLAVDIAAVRERARQLRGEEARVDVQVLTPHAKVLSGAHSVTEHRDHLAALESAGVDWFIVRPPGETVDAVIAGLEAYSAQWDA